MPVCVLSDMKNKDIFDTPQEVYVNGCLSCAWLGNWTKAFRESRTAHADDPRSGRLSILDRVQHIHAKVEYALYQSGSVMARDRDLSKIYVLEVRKKVFKLRKYSLDWVLRPFNDDQKAGKVERVASMLSIFEPLTAHACSWTLTEDKSWSYFSYNYEGKWALLRDSSMMKPKA
jgi:hypothetical protein